MFAVVYQYQRVPPMPPGRLAAPLVSMVFTEPPPPEPSIMPDDRQAEIVRHLLGHQRLGRDRGIRRAAAHGEIVADHDHGAAVDLAAAEHAVRRRQVREFAVLVIFGRAGNRADLVEAFRIDQTVDALANGEPALVALPLDLVNAAHLARERFAPSEIVEFRLPVHSYPPS